MQARTLIPAAAAVTATALVGGLASRPADSPWYRSLRKPSYQPPKQAFPIVWPMLYADIAIVSSNALDEMTRRGQETERRRYIAALALNLVLNGGWSWLFFNRRLLATSAAAAAVLAASSIDLTPPRGCRTGHARRPASPVRGMVHVCDSPVQSHLVPQQALTTALSTNR